LTAVIVVFAALLWFTLDGWKRPRIVVPLVSVLAPVCALAAVFVAMALSLAITEPLKPPLPPQEGGHRSQEDARAHPLRDDALRRTGFPNRRPFSCGHSVGYAVCFTIRFAGGTNAALIFAPVRIGFDLRLV
jgi:hypothetical protein